MPREERVQNSRFLKVPFHAAHLKSGPVHVALRRRVHIVAANVGLYFGDYLLVRFSIIKKRLELGTPGEGKHTNSKG
jgi:hypothetical protein